MTPPRSRSLFHRLLAAALLLGAGHIPASAQAAPAAQAAPQDSTAALFAGFQSNSSGPVQVDAQSLDVYEQGTERVSEFTGNVVVTRGDTVLKADSIKLHQDLNNAQSDAFTMIEANGGVSVSDKDETLTGKSAVLDMTKNSIIVSGGVVLSQGANTLTGTDLVVDLASGRARLEGGSVRGVFTPSSTPAAPATAAGKGGK